MDGLIKKFSHNNQHEPQINVKLKELHFNKVIIHLFIVKCLFFRKGVGVIHLLMKAEQYSSQNTAFC